MEILLPSQNADLSEAEFARACALLDYYREEAALLPAYCLQRGRGVTLFDRANIWREGFVDGIGRLITSKKYNNVNRLRLIGWHFASYRLFDMGGAVDPPANEWMQRFFNCQIEELPDDVDTIILEAIDPVERSQRLIPWLQRLMGLAPHEYLAGQPARLGEVGAKLNGRWVNGDSVRYWATVVTLHRTGALDYLQRQIDQRGFCRVLEVGPGYGGQAYHLKKIFGDRIQFICVDIVDSLIFSSIYLNTVFENEPHLLYRGETSIGAEYRTIYVPAFRAPEFFEAITDVDLSLSAVTMNDISEAQVDFYGRSLSEVMSPGGFFFEANWIDAGAPKRIAHKPFLMPHFRQRTSIDGSEVSHDGNLDLWSNDIDAEVLARARSAYPGQVRHVETDDAWGLGLD